MINTTFPDLIAGMDLTNSSSNNTECSTDVLMQQILEKFVPKSLYVDRYTTPILYIIGFPGNILSFIIWIQRRMRHSSGYYLAAIALSDIFFLALQIVYELQNAWFLSLLDFPVLCEGYPVLFLTCQYLPPLLVLGFTVERYISVCHPFHRERYCTTKRAKIVIISLVVFSFSLSAIQAYFWTYDTKCKNCRPRQWILETSFWTAWTWIVELLIFLLVPVLVLIFNILVILEVNHLSKVEKTQLHGNEHRTSATTIMLLSVSFYLIFTVLPVTLTVSLFPKFPMGNTKMSEEAMRADPVWQRHFNYVFAKTIVSEIGLTHFVCNFYIYLITGKQFRKELEKLVMSVLCSKLSAHRPSEYTTLFTSLRDSNTKAVNARNSVNGHTLIPVNKATNENETVVTNTTGVTLL